MRIYPVVTSSTISQSLCQYGLLRGLNAHITDTMGYNCTFETATRHPIYDYLGSLHPPIIDTAALNSTFVVRGACVAFCPQYCLKQIGRTSQTVARFQIFICTYN